PLLAAYEITPTYSTYADDKHTAVMPVGAGGWTVAKHDAYPPNFILLSRTPDVSGGQPKRPDSEVQEAAVHEGTHAMDKVPKTTPWERSPTEFRAYWNDGRFGAPDKPTDRYAAVVDPTMQPPGPKSPRANKIFRLMYDDPVLYDFCKPNYDANTD